AVIMREVPPAVFAEPEMEVFCRGCVDAPVLKVVEILPVRRRQLERERKLGLLLADRNLNDPLRAPALLAQALLDRSVRLSPRAPVSDVTTEVEVDERVLSERLVADEAQPDVSVQVVVGAVTTITALRA